MAEEVETLTLQDDFYHDGKGKILFILFLGFVIFGLLSAIAVHLYQSKPAPITIKVGNEWRVQPEIPLEQPYLSPSEILQWISDILPDILTFDFVHYDNELKTASQYFTSNGWKVFLNQLNNYANYTIVQNNRLFVSVEPTAAPFFLNQGLVLGRYGWWVQIPVTLKFAGYKALEPQDITLQLLVVRVPTLNNLSGVGIDNVIILKGNLKSPTVAGNGQPE